MLTLIQFQNLETYHLKMVLIYEINMKVLDLCSGIGSFGLASKRLGWETIGFAEIDSYAAKVLDKHFGLNNFHDVREVGIPESCMEYQSFIDEDLVPAEEVGHDIVTYEDFMEGVIPFPNVICSGSPCQDISPSSPTNSQGVTGNKSGLIFNNLDTLEDLDASYFVLENSSNLNQRGLCLIVKRLIEIGYYVEWETISAAHFGYPHYRHRIFMVAYKKHLYNGSRLFDVVTGFACHEPFYRFPCINDWDDKLLKTVNVEIPKSIKNRQARVGTLGNSIIPAISYSVLRAVDVHSRNTNYLKLNDSSGWIKLEELNYVKSEKFVDIFRMMPQRGFATEFGINSLPKCSVLNPSKTTYKGMLSTLLANDKKNNFTTRSRLNRPGGLGGLVGTFMHMGVNKGALCPNFCEQYMGFEKNYTLLNGS